MNTNKKRKGFLTGLKTLKKDKKKKGKKEWKRIMMTYWP